MRLLRRSEWVITAYLAYATAAAFALGVRPPVPYITAGVNAAVIGGFFLLGWAVSLRGREFLGIMRDWYPVSLMLLCYREMGWFAPERRDYRLEHVWEAWDKVLLNSWGLRRGVELLGPALPFLLEIAYLLVYSIPSFAMAMLYAYRRRDRVNAFLFQFLLGILIAYVLFPYFPSEPPRTVFPGQDLPSYNTLFRRVNWWLLGGYGIHTSVFPSAHVSGAFSGAFGMMRLLPEHPWVGRFLAVLAAAIVLATVYGRYHYAADALAGFGVSLVALAIAAAVDRRLRLAAGALV